CAGRPDAHAPARADPRAAPGGSTHGAVHHPRDRRGSVPVRSRGAHVRPARTDQGHHRTRLPRRPVSLVAPHRAVRGAVPRHLVPPARRGADGDDGGRGVRWQSLTSKWPIIVGPVVILGLWELLSRSEILRSTFFPP